MTDPIAILEAAYEMTGSEHEWLSRLADTVRQNLDEGDWVVAQTYDVTRPDHVATRAAVTSGIDMAKAAEIASQLALPRSDDQIMTKIWRNGFVGSLRASPAALRRAGLEAHRVREFERVLDDFLRRWNWADQLWVNAQDPTSIGCLLIAPVHRRGRLYPRDVHRWSCVAAHVATAFRIRRQFASHSSESAAGAVPSSQEAVLAPDGKLEHADLPAQGNAARAALRRAVLALDRARGPLRRRGPEEAVAIWHALVDGRWSLLDHFDSDGRRFVVAHRNDATVPDARGLTHRERQVIAYAALGHANKVIAYELGLSASTVAGHLARARAKLQLPSRAALHAASEP